MRQFEKDYATMVYDIIAKGEIRETRNGATYGMFGKSLTVPVYDHFPLLQGRSMHYKGVLGEFAALIRQPKCLADFEKWGCNYWKLWADECRS